MTSGDWLPAQAPFDQVRRGYSPEQVTAHLERLEYDLRIATANRDATNQRVSELGAQLSATQAEADTLRTELDRAALAPVSMSGLSERMQRMIRLAEEEAGDIRARAETDGDRLRAQLEASLAEAVEARASFDAERERTRKQLAEQVHGLIGEANAEAEDTRAQAEEECTRLLQEANAEADRTVVEAKRYAEQTTNETNHATSTLLAKTKATTQALVLDAQHTAETLTEESRLERVRLAAEALAHRTQIQDDFDIAISSRRAQAAKDIADREAHSIATANTLVSDATAQANTLVTDATAHANSLVADATAEADLLMQRATTYSTALVNRAAMESHQRVVDADQAVGELHDLRSRIHEQLGSLSGHLDHIRKLAGSAPALLAPPASESARPRPEHFPADPAGRPTEVPVPIPVLEKTPKAAARNRSSAESSNSAGDQSQITGPTDESVREAKAETPAAEQTLGDGTASQKVPEAQSSPGDADTDQSSTRNDDSQSTVPATNGSSSKSSRPRSFGSGRSRR